MFNFIEFSKRIATVLMLLLLLCGAAEGAVGEFCSLDGLAKFEVAPEGVHNYVRNYFKSDKKTPPFDFCNSSHTVRSLVSLPIEGQLDYVDQVDCVAVFVVDVGRYGLNQQAEHFEPLLMLHILNILITKINLDGDGLGQLDEEAQEEGAEIEFGEAGESAEVVGEDALQCHQEHYEEHGLLDNQDHCQLVEE